ncbi:MAG: leucine-rich repeat domain-containing protein [Clostridia bacterium]|nr:leucine-rich repeat domain-containing protein [Clostridia bacterium]
MLYINNHLIDAKASITDVSIKANTRTIAAYAFSYHISLTGVTIPDSVTSIGANAFSNCRSLASVTIPDSVTSIGDGAFSNTAYYNNEGNWENGILYINNHLIEAKRTITDVSIKANTRTIAAYAFVGCSSLTSVTIPDSVTSIGDGAFVSCSSLTSITIPDSVTSIGESVFSDCSSLTSISVAEGNIEYSSENGVLLNKNKTTLICCPGGKSGSYIIPDSVTSFSPNAFSYCSLTSVTIGNGMTSIGDGAFRDCSSLTSVTLGNSVTSIGEHAFAGCGSLTSVTIPDSVMSIKMGAFEVSSNLNDVYYSGTKEQWSAIHIGEANEALTGADIHYNICILEPEFEVETIAADVNVEKTFENGKLVLTVSSDAMDLSDVRMFVASYNGNDLQYATEGAKDLSGKEASFTAALPWSNYKIFLWDSKQRPLTKVTEIQ